MTETHLTGAASAVELPSSVRPGVNVFRSDEWRCSGALRAALCSLCPRGGDGENTRALPDKAEALKFLFLFVLFFLGLSYKCFVYIICRYLFYAFHV